MLGPRKRIYRLPWRTPAADVESELSAHVEERVADLVHAGSSPSDARAQATAELGDYDAVRDELVSIDRRIAQQQSRRDQLELLSLPFRHAFRRLSRQPGFLALAAGSLALALGATTAAIGFADAWNHPAVSYDAPERTAAIQMWGGPVRQDRAIRAIDRWRRIAESLPLDGYALTGLEANTVRVGDQVIRDAILKVTANFGTVTGVHMKRGRSFVAGASDEGAVLVSDAFWRRYFGDRKQIGDATLMVGGRWYKIIGVMPRSPMWPMSFNVFRLMTPAEEQQLQWPIVRLAPSTSVPRVQQQLDALAATMSASTDPSRPYGFALRPFTEQLRVGLDGIHGIMLLAAFVVLAIACANLTALLLARVASRRRDFALRLSLGASRGAIVADVLAELALISLVGLLGGLALANGATGILRALVPVEITWSTSIEMNWSWRVFALSVGILSMVVVLVGLLPALQVLRIPLMEPLKESTGGAIARQPQRMRSVVMLQLAAALVMLILTGAHIAAAMRRVSFDFGFDARRVIGVAGDFVYKWNTVNIGDRSTTDYVLSRAMSTQGIAVATYFAGAKPDGLQVISDDMGTADHPLLIDQYTIAGPRFFDATGIPLVEGRDFAEGDSIAGAIILDQTAAKALFPSGSALGRRVRMGRANSSVPWRTVVGVARNVALRFPPTTIPARSPAIYVAQSLPDTRKFAIAARVAPGADVQATTQRLRTEVASVLPYSVTLSVATFSASQEASVRAQRQLATLFGSLAFGALLFAGAGLFAVLSYAVGQRMRELAVRVAVGATKADLARLVLRDTAELVLGGTAIGGTAGLCLTIFISGPVFGAEGVTAWALISAELILLTVAAIAAIGPTLRALEADPVDMLRAS